MTIDICTDLDNTDVTPLSINEDEYNNILTIQQEILLLAAYEQDTQKVLNQLCLMAERLLPNSAASLMLFKSNNNSLYVKAAPSLSLAGKEALDGIVPGPQSGSCANAVYYNKAQYVENLFKDKRGLKFVDTAKKLDICSCWSMPIKDENVQTIGSFALYSFEHRSPAQFHKKLLEVCSTIATIVLKNQRMVLYDSLTGFKNKVSLQQEIKENHYNTLIFLDVNNFSYINTAYGFTLGDEILLKISQMLHSLNISDHIYRINSDQFALRFEKKVAIEEIVNHIKQFFSHATIKVDNVNVKVSFNYGAVYSNKDLLKHAALAIKKAKEHGKNKLYIYTKESDDSKLRASFIAMNNTLYEAFENECIVPYFQGIYDNYQNKIIKYEALVRIQTKTGEIIPPYKFLEVARLSGLLPKLTKIMIHKSFQIMANNDFDFSINITEEDLNSQYLFAYLIKKAKEHNIAHYRVNLEILEGISATGKKDNLEQLKELKASGFKISIDDFGAEYSNFERVLELDVDFLKIDAKYIKNIDKDKKSYEITKAIVNFAKSMQIYTVAEFVHSKEVQEMVEKLGIDYSQGYYFSEPSPELLS